MHGSLRPSHDEDTYKYDERPLDINIYVHYRRASFCQKLILLMCAILMVFGLMAIAGMVMCMAKWGGQPEMSVGRCWKWMWLWR